MSYELTHKEALLQLAGLRRNGFNAGQLKAWETELAEWHPEAVLEAGRKLARRWAEPGDWQISNLLHELPPVASSESKSYFTWCPLTGGVRGDWKVFDRIDEDERLAIALTVLDLPEDRWIEHRETASRMHAGVFEFREAQAMRVQSETG